jgi:hypothetical protein
MAQSNHRIRFNFWLDMTKPSEEGIADKIEYLKNKRSFSSAIRDGIRLIVDLRQGKLDVLFELFPFVKLEVMEYLKDAKADSNGGGDDIKRELNQLKQLILAQNKQNDTLTMKPVSNGNVGINQIDGIKTIDAPVFDDSEDDLELLTVERDTESGKRATQNFLNSMMALQQ